MDYQLAHELDSLEHGLFSYYFVQGIQTGNATDISKKYINISELCRYIQDQIASNHTSINQEPVMSGEDMVGELIISLNPKFDPKQEHQAEFLDYIKRSLDISDLSDKDKLEKAQIKQLNKFLDKLNDEINTLGIQLTAFKQSIVEHGRALGLDNKTTTNIFDNYISALEF